MQKRKALLDPKTAGSPQYIMSLLLKINEKLGGINLVVDPSALGLRETPTIVFGVDVNHAPPSSSKPSSRHRRVARRGLHAVPHVVGAQQSRRSSST